MATNNIPTSIGVSIACDHSGFMRYECCKCALEFKEAVDADSMQDILSASVTRSLSEQGVESDEPAKDSSIPNRCCPYCHYQAPRQDFIHSEVSSYLKHVVQREIIEPLISKMFSGFASGTRNTKFFSITMTHSPSRSQRPFSGPEPDDQIVVRCLECKQRFKVFELWRGSIWCTYCETELFPQ